MTSQYDWRVERITTAELARTADLTFVRPTFEEVYRETFPFVWRMARRLGVGDSTRDDVAQEVFVTVYRRLDEFEGRCSVKTWVRSILRGMVLNYRRTQRRKAKGQALSTTAVDPEMLSDMTPDPSELASRAQASRILHDLLAQLSEEKAVVFTMATFEGMTGREIAKLVNVNVNTVYSRLRAARKEFEQALARLLASGGVRG